MLPFDFTRSYSERCVRRLVFGNESELTLLVCVAKTFVRERAASKCSRIRDPPLRTKEVFHRKSGEDFSKKEFQPYCEGGDTCGDGESAQDKTLRVLAGCEAVLLASRQCYEPIPARPDRVVDPVPQALYQGHAFRHTEGKDM